MPPSDENSIFDDVMITLAILSDKEIFDDKFYMFLVKSIIGIMSAKNCNNRCKFNRCKFVKVIQQKL